MRDVVDAAQRQLGWYVRNCALGPAAGRLEEELALALEYLRRVPNSADDYLDLTPKEKKLAFRRDQRRTLRRYAKLVSDSDESLEQNALFAREEFRFDEIDTEILLLVLRYERNWALEHFSDQVAHRLSSASRAVAALLNIETREAHRRILPSSALGDSGVLSIRHGATGLAGPSGFLQIAPPLRKVMFRPYKSREEWRNDIFGPPLAPMLAWQDFAHLGVDRDLAARVLSGASQRGVRGVNLLFHGPVGTGKTEFCKTLAARCGLAMWSIGETDQEGGEPNRLERLSSLRLAQHLLKRRQNAVILFEEAEDLLEQFGSRGDFPFHQRNGSKVHVNRLFEQNVVPVLWTCNELNFIDPAVSRRMTLPIEIRTPNRSVRAGIWRRIAANAGLQLDEAAVRRLSTHEAPPAVAANAVKAAVLAGGGEAEINMAMSGALRILGIGPSPSETGSHEFAPQLVNCGEDLAALVERLAAPGALRAWSLCIHGAPGTGKSLFARHIARRLALEVIKMRASDLLSEWVGGSEKRIAAAFAAARDQGALLLIDEADLLLSDRRGAMQSWEVSQVNEMLTWMEEHPLPFVCTTNLMERLDQASLRRFTIKLRFDALDGQQAAYAFEHYFGVAASRSLPDGLTPGDFATVYGKRELFKCTNPNMLVEWLEQEVEAKGLRTRAMGFLTPRDTGTLLR